MHFSCILALLFMFYSNSGLYFSYLDVCMFVLDFKYAGCFSLLHFTIHVALDSIMFTTSVSDEK